MTETVSASKKTLKTLNTKYVNDEKYRIIMNKHIPPSNISRWNGCVRNTVLLKQSFKKNGIHLTQIYLKYQIKLYYHRVKNHDIVAIL